MKLIIATNNEHKVAEYKQFLGDLFSEVLSLKEVGRSLDVEETGSTFLENACIKAQSIKVEGAAVLADDSGLCVDALDGLPGVYSARYAADDGCNADDGKNRRKLLKQLEGVQNRKARFVAAVALVFEDKIFTAEGQTDGRILLEEQGDNGFGYDSIFFSDELNKSFGQASCEEKNSISHRGRAIKNLLKKFHS